MITKNLKKSLPKDILEVIDKDSNCLGNTESERIKNLLISPSNLKNLKKEAEFMLNEIINFYDP